MPKGLLVQNKRSLSAAFLISFLITCFLAGSVSPSPQPPLDSTTYNIATFGQPLRLDPARAYDTASGELIQNVYETLISCSDKHPVNFTPGIGYNLSISDYSYLTQYKPVLATEVPTVENGRLIANSSGSYWRFTVKTNAIFQPWTAANGSVMPSRNAIAEDVVYSFRRMVIYDSLYGPAWLFETPAFGVPSWRDIYGGLYSTYSNGTFKHVADEATAATLIQNWCYNVGNDVYFHFQRAWSENIMKQLFSQTWGSVVNPDWVKEMGGWDGLFTTGASDANMSAGWSNNYHMKPTDTRSELDTYKSPSIYGAKGSTYSFFSYGMCGTGPYQFTSWDIVSKIRRIDHFSNYWLGFDQAGDGAGNFIETVVWKEVDAWPTRMMQFLEGEFDVATVPTANRYDMLQAGSNCNPIQGVNLVNDIPVLSARLISFNMHVTDAVGGMYVGYPTHIRNEPTFFSNIHIRRAFAWALNYTSYVQDAWDGEAIVQSSWWIDGLSPPSFKNANSSMPLRNLDYSIMQSELNQAIINGVNVSEAGFDITIMYLRDYYNYQDLMPFNMIAQAFATLNATKYKLTLQGVDLTLSWDDKDRSMFAAGWLADMADPNNLCEPFQASWGNYMAGQGPPFPEDQTFVDAEIQAALVETDPNLRGEMYKDLQYRFWLDVPSIPLAQPLIRRWARDWVQGWYFNALLPGEFAYDLYKAPVASDTVDVDATDTITAGPGPTYGTTLIFKGGMYLGFLNGTPHLLALEGMNYTVSVKYNSGSVANLLVAVGLKRNSSQPLYGETQYPCVYKVVLSPGQNSSGIFWWQEDGKDQVVSAGDSFDADTGTIYSVGLEAYPVNARDINTSNNYVFTQYWNASRLIGDIKSDGIVDIYDALKLSGAFGTTPSNKHWNPDADLKGDGVIDIYDGIMLSNNFNKHVP